MGFFFFLGFMFCAVRGGAETQYFLKAQLSPSPTQFGKNPNRARIFQRKNHGVQFGLGRR
jgi:hypothetical protein